MGTISNPNSWSPYDSYNDCSQGICNIYCPQWCFLIFPPPPPPPSFFFNDSSSSSNFSPLLIALIGILTSALVLVSYYTLISKYCHRHHENSSSEAHNYDHKMDGFVDCSVCLSEFEENESLRLLPKCNHAFHLPCIDTWLKSHSNCPLCRAFVTGVNPTLTEATSIVSVANQTISVTETNLNLDGNQNQTGDSGVVIEDLEIRSRNSNGRSELQLPEEPIRRSVSLNSGLVVSIADVLRESGDEEESVSVGTSHRREVGGNEYSERKTEAETAGNQRSGVSNFLVRSLSTGRFIFTSKKLPFT